MANVPACCIDAKVRSDCLVFCDYKADYESTDQSSASAIACLAYINPIIKCGVGEYTAGLVSAQPAGSVSATNLSVSDPQRAVGPQNCALTNGN